MLLKLWNVIVIAGKNNKKNVTHTEKIQYNLKEKEVLQTHRREKQMRCTHESRSLRCETQLGHGTEPRGRKDVNNEHNITVRVLLF